MTDNQNKIEQLTEEERARLENWCEVNDKALRIIDAQAAAVQALTDQVAQLTELAIAWEEDPLVPELRAENARLTEALAEVQKAHTSANSNRQLADARCARLTEQVAQLTAERDELKVCLDISRGCRKAAEAENARLTEALAAAERKAAHFDEQCAANLARAEAAELARDAALALINTFNFTHIGEWYEARTKFLEGQPAAPARTEAEARTEVDRIVRQELTGKEKGVMFVRLRREITEKHPSIPPQQVFRSVSQLIESRDVSFTPAGALALKKKAIGEFNPDGEGPSMAALDLHYKARAEAAERDRDAANRLLVRAKGQLQAFAHTTISRAALMTDLDAHLSSQPAQAPTSTLGHPGADEVFARLRQSRQPAAPAPTTAETELAALRERVARVLEHADRYHEVDARWLEDVLRGR